MWSLSCQSLSHAISSHDLFIIQATSDDAFLLYMYNTSNLEFAVPVQRNGCDTIKPFCEHSTTDVWFALTNSVSQPLFLQAITSQLSRSSMVSPHSHTCKFHVRVLRLQPIHVSWAAEKDDSKRLGSWGAVSVLAGGKWYVFGHASASSYSPGDSSVSSWSSWLSSPSSLASPSTSLFCHKWVKGSQIQKVYNLR